MSLSCLSGLSGLRAIVSAPATEGGTEFDFWHQGAPVFTAGTDTSGLDYQHQGTPLVLRQGSA